MNLATALRPGVGARWLHYAESAQPPAIAATHGLSWPGAAPERMASRWKAAARGRRFWLCSILPVALAAVTWGTYERLVATFVGRVD